MLCNLCPRKCNKIRTNDIGNGFCNSPDTIKVALVDVHKWEEPCISADNGCGAVFFSGCTLKCVYCQNYDISHKNQGKPITTKQLSDKIKQLEARGVTSIEFVSGTHYVDKIISCLDIYKPDIPVIYNSSGYESVDTLKKLEGYIDVYLPDFKYSINAVSEKYSGVSNYKDVAINAIKEMLSQVGRYQLDGNGIIKKGVIIRHLVLPSNTKNSIGVLDLIKQHFNSDVLVSLMGQYTPYGNADKYPEINRKITKREYDKVLNHLINLELDGFAQDLESATTDYIPHWDI